MIDMFEEAENFNRDFAPNKNPDPKPDPKPKKKNLATNFKRENASWYKNW